MSEDENWIHKRLDHLNEDQIEYFKEKVGHIMNDNDGTSINQARRDSLLLLLDYMRR